MKPRIYFTHRVLTYLSEDQAERLELLIKDADEKQAEYLRNIIIEHLNKNNELIKSLENERANERAKGIRP